MTRFLNSIVTLVVGLLVVVFAASNRALVDLTIWPLPFALSVPIYAVALAGVALGVVWGGIVAWLSAGSARRRARAEARRAADLEKDLRVLKEKTELLEQVRPNPSLPPR